MLPLLAELPGGGATSVINSVAYSRIHWKYLQQVGEYKGVKLLGVFTHGPGQMFNTKRAITKVEDLAGMKIRSGGGISEEMARALGASAFVKPAPESYELLSSGVADGTFFPAESIISFKLGPVIKYATMFPGGFYSSAFGFFMNEDKWNKLPKEDQDAILSVSGEAIARLAGKARSLADGQTGRRDEGRDRFITPTGEDGDMTGIAGERHMARPAGERAVGGERNIAIGMNWGDRQRPVRHRNARPREQPTGHQGFGERQRGGKAARHPQHREPVG